MNQFAILLIYMAVASALTLLGVAVGLAAMKDVVSDLRMRVAHLDAMNMRATYAAYDRERQILDAQQSMTVNAILNGEHECCATLGETDDGRSCCGCPPGVCLAEGLDDDSEEGDDSFDDDEGDLDD